MKRRILALLLALVLLFTLAACGTEAPAGDDANDAAQTPGDVSLKDLPDDTAEDDNSDSVPEDDATDETAEEHGDAEDGLHAEVPPHDRAADEQQHAVDDERQHADG